MLCKQTFAKGRFWPVGDSRKSTLSSPPDERSKAVIQPSCMFNAKVSNGLVVPPAATFRTWV